MVICESLPLKFRKIFTLQNFLYSKMSPLKVIMTISYFVTHASMGAHVWNRSKFDTFFIFILCYEKTLKKLLGRVILVWNCYSKQSAYDLIKRRTLLPLLSGESFENVWLWMAASRQSEIAALNHCHKKRKDSLETRAVLIEIFMLYWNSPGGPKYRGWLQKKLCFPWKE